MNCNPIILNYMTTKQVRNKLEQLKGAKIQYIKLVKDTRVLIRNNIKDLAFHEQAREIVRIIGLKTQQQLQFHISDITSLALESVFLDEAYELQAEFVQRRNKTECDLNFVRDENKMNPLEASGLGAVDVASFALRVASWSMKFPKYRNTIILDEPFRYLSKDKQEKASEMIKKISEKLKIQFIIVTHEKALSESADKLFETEITGGVSKIT